MIGFLFALSLSLLNVNPVLCNALGDTIKWIDARELGIGGKGWKDNSPVYGRLPVIAEGHVPAYVWDLSKQTAGLYVVDGTHPTDLGFMRQSDAYELIIRSILQKLQ